MTGIALTGLAGGILCIGLCYAIAWTAAKAAEADREDYPRDDYAHGDWPSAPTIITPRGE